MLIDVGQSTMKDINEYEIRESSRMVVRCQSVVREMKNGSCWMHARSIV